MKFKCILAFLLLFSSVFSYTYISPLFDTEITRNIENRGGLFANQSLLGANNPATFELNTKIYYRIVLFDPPLPITNTNTTNVIITNTNTNSTASNTATNGMQTKPEGETVIITNTVNNTVTNTELTNVQAATNTNMTERFKIYSLKNTRLDFGIENNFSSANDRLGLFVYFEPVSFFSMGLRAYSTFWYTALKSGYIGYDTLDNIKYSKTDLKDSTNKASKQGFLISFSPSIHFKVGSFIFQNTTTFSYEYVGDKPYYFNNRIFLPHRKHGFDINNDTYLLGNTYPIFVGIYYGFTYINTYNKLEHRFGVAAMTHYKFLKDKLLLDIGAASGVNLTLDNYEGATFIEARVAVNYRIF